MTSLNFYIKKYNPKEIFTPVQVTIKEYFSTSNKKMRCFKLRTIVKLTNFN